MQPTLLLCSFGTSKIIIVTARATIGPDINLSA
jgi:hypothetical protein